MVRQGTVSRPPHTTPYHMSYLPMSSLTHIIACPASDCCDTTVPVTPIDKVGPLHQQVLSRDRVEDHDTVSGTDICVSVRHISWIPFLQILARAHKSYRLGGFYTTYLL
jgi:hypothetical protein